MEYQINKTLLYALIDEEVSKVADEAYGDNGVSLYDSIVLTEKDSDTVDRLIDDAVRAFVARLYDVCRFSSDSIEFHLPDFDESMEESAMSEITRFIVFTVCMILFQERRAQALPEYSERAQAALNKAITLLKSRKSPTEIW